MALLVPKDLVGNLLARQRLLERARGSREVREALWVLCSRDLLAFVNLCCWTYDPRLVKEDRDPIIPWITWEYQDKALLTMEAAIGKHPLIIEKSRDMGATWMLMAVFTHQWLFRKNRSFLLASRTEDLVDSRGDTDSLFWKIEFLIRHLPEWMKPPMERTALHIANKDRQNVIDGSSTNDDLGRGGRRTAVGYDEFPAVDQAHEVHSASSSLTECPIYMGTHKGVGTKFYELTQTQMPRIRLHWTLHPRKSDGLYYDEDGKPRSPWYDSLGPIFGMTKQQIASEVDIDPAGSSFNFFDEADLLPLETDLVREPTVGTFSYNSERAEPEGFATDPGGKFSVWQDPDPTHEYVIGVDIAAGTGNSNSVICVGDCFNGEQVMEFASNRILPHELARLAVALCRWFKGMDNKGAFLIWESSGPTGKTFGQEVIDLGYRNLYFRTKDDALGASPTTNYGYMTTGSTKETLLGNLRGGMVSRRFRIRSKRVYREWRGYNFKDGRVLYTASAQSGDESDKGASHGDAVIAAGICWHSMKVRVGRDPDVPLVRVALPGSLAWRRSEALKESQELQEAEQW